MKTLKKPKLRMVCFKLDEKMIEQLKKEANKRGEPYVDVIRAGIIKELNVSIDKNPL